MHTNKNKGFSLVELIVVLTIIAVFMAVLAPALLAYVNDSRQQRDDSAMGEVCRAILLSMSDQYVYDEVCRYAIQNNYSCYVDSTVTEDTELFYPDDTRILDGESYSLAGQMRGITLTMIPSVVETGDTEFVLADAMINYGFAGAKVINERQPIWVHAQPDETTLGDMSLEHNRHHLHKAVRSAIGDSVKAIASCYRNSNYTIFIKLGSDITNTGKTPDELKVYGQWNGTNLYSYD